MLIPKPPSRLLEAIHPTFAPAPDIRDWAYATFIEEGAPLQNPDHEHLKDAQILFLWSSIPFTKTGRQVVGTAQRGFQSGSLGKKELIEQRFREWNAGDLPDFVITLCAPYLHEASERGACALVEHELYHCAQETDLFGAPAFTDSGMPKWTIRGHDIEEFVGIVARYGAYSPELMALQTVLARGPLVAPEEINAVCGCGARVG